MEKVLTDRMSQKWFVKVRAGDFSPDDASQWGTPVEVDSDQIETVIENNQCYSRHTQNIQISKIIFENEKFLLFYKKNPKWTFWPTQ